MLGVWVLQDSYKPLAFVAGIESQSSDHSLIITRITVGATAAGFNRSHRLLKLFGGFWLLLEIAMMRISADEVWGYCFGRPALDTEIGLDVERTWSVLGISLRLRHKENGTRGFGA